MKKKDKKQELSEVKTINRGEEIIGKNEPTGGKKTYEEETKETPKGIPEQTPIQIPVKTSEKTPEQTPIQIPVKTPEKIPIQIPVKTSEKIPIQIPVQIPVKAPMQIPVQTPEETPEEIDPMKKRKREEYLSGIIDDEEIKNDIKSIKIPSRFISIFQEDKTAMKGFVTFRKKSILEKKWF